MSFVLTALAINVTGLMIVFFLLRRRLDRALASTELLRQVESEIDAVITALNQTTERNINLLEEKIHGLKGLIGKADHRLSLMSKQLDQGLRKGPIVYARPSQLTGKKASPPNEDNPGASSLEAAPKKSKEDLLPRRIQALNWHRQGVEKTVIASRLGITRGEVDLIVSLGNLEKG